MSICVLVIGTPRSGTSCIAGVLHRLGVRMALNTFSPPRKANPTGFYEDFDLVWLLANADTATKEDKEKANAELTAGIVERCSSGSIWGAKSFLLLPNLDTVVAACKMPIRIIRTVREKEKSIESWSKAVGGNGAWIANYAEMLDAKLKSIETPVLEISFDEMLLNPNVVVGSLSQFVEVETSQQAIDFVDPSLRSVK